MNFAQTVVPLETVGGYEWVLPPCVCALLYELNRGPWGKRQSQPIRPPEDRNAFRPGSVPQRALQLIESAHDSLGDFSGYTAEEVSRALDEELKLVHVSLSDLVRRHYLQTVLRSKPRRYCLPPKARG